MRRALPPLLALVLALALLTGCEFSLERLAHGGALPPPPEDYTGLQDGFRYTQTTLTGQERYLYDQLLAGLQNQEETIGDLYPDTEMIQTAIDAIDRDYPELFWFSGTGQIETTLLAGKPLEAAYTPVYTMDQAQRQATQAQSAVTEMTNQLLQKNADMLKMGTVEAAREAERSIVDVKTLQHTNEQLISTLDEVMKIQTQAKPNLSDAEAALGRIEGELKQKLLELRG